MELIKQRSTFIRTVLFSIINIVLTVVILNCSSTNISVLISYIFEIILIIQIINILITFFRNFIPIIILFLTITIILHLLNLKYPFSIIHTDSLRSLQLCLILFDFVLIIKTFIKLKHTISHGINTLKQRHATKKKLSLFEAKLNQNYNNISNSINYINSQSTARTEIFSNEEIDNILEVFKSCEIPAKNTKQQIILVN